MAFSNCQSLLVQYEMAFLFNFHTYFYLYVWMQDEDNDAMLLGAQFCSDSFSSISLDAVKEGTSYSLYARYNIVFFMCFCLK